MLRKKSVMLPVGVILFCVLLNLAAWHWTAFCDWYRAYIFPVWLNLLGRLTSLVSISVGEIMIAIFLLLIAGTILTYPILMFVKKKKRKKVSAVFGKIYLWVAAFILLTETLNCFILYHTSTFAEEYGISGNKHSDAQLVKLAELLIDEGNAAAKNVSRDADGAFVLSADLNETAKASMRNIADDYPQLDGFYPTPKKIKASFFMSQQSLMGIYFPFSMEANYNDQMYALNLPETVCHELAHTRGFMLEDEANFISFLSCTQSKNADYVYSGYVAAIKYVMGQVSENCSTETKALLDARISDEIYVDLYRNSRYWQEVQEDDSALLPSDVVGEISDKAMDSSLKLNGVEDGKESYGRMVDLLLNYYEDELQ